MKLLRRIAVACIVGTFVYAQQGVQLGLGISPAITFSRTMQKDTTDGSFVEAYKANGFGFKGGLLLNLGITDNYGFFSGIQLFLRNFKNKDSVNTQLSMLTVEIPLSFRLRTNEIGSGLHITGQFGASADINVDARHKVGGKKIQVDKYYDIVSFTFLVGAGVEFDLEFGRILAGISYHLGITDFIRQNYEETITLPNGQTQKVKPFENIKTIPSHIALDLGFFF